MKDIEELEEKIQRLINDKSITGYRIEKDTGISQTHISRLRSRKYKLDNISWEFIKKLYLYAKKELH